MRTAYIPFLLLIFILQNIGMDAVFPLVLQLIAFFLCAGAQENAKTISEFYATFYDEIAKSAIEGNLVDANIVGEWSGIGLFIIYELKDISGHWAFFHLQPNINYLSTAIS